MIETAGPSANPYAAPAGSDPDAGGAELTYHELKAFAGLAGAYYWSVWIRSGRRKGMWPSWNWPAALFSSLWMAYRKMWREFLVVVVSYSAWGVLEPVLASLVGREYLINIWLDWVAYSVLLGFLGNALYLRRVRLEAEEARRLFPEDPDGREAYLARIGGTSGWSVVAGVGALAAIGVLQNWLTSLIARLL